MTPDFNKYAEEGNKFLREFAWEINLEGQTEKAGRILTATLHALRDIITLEESIQLMAQLPAFLKAVYVTGWSVKKHKPKLQTIQEFIDLVKRHDHPYEDADFEGEDAMVEYYINGTFIYLQKYVSRGEMEDIRDILPKDLKGIVHTWGTL